MNIHEAHSECRRWLAHLDAQKKRADDIQKIAADRRSGRITEAQARIELRQHDRGLTVYDGSRLADAVRFLLTETGGDE
jgi:hypothetical protein